MAQSERSKIYDRWLTIHDEKMRIVDLPNTTLIPPETGIYEGDLRYYAASPEWRKIIEGWVSWLTELAAWQLAENEGYPAIQEILTFLEGVDVSQIEIPIEDQIAKLESEGYIVATPQELENAVCAGVICAAEELASRITLAQTGNIRNAVEISQNESGVNEIVVRAATDTTAIILADEVRFGGMHGIGEGFREIIQFLNSQQGTGLTANDIADLLVTFYAFIGGSQIASQALIDAINFYYLNATDQFTPVPNTTSIALFLNCNGNTKSALAKWAFEYSQGNTTDAYDVGEAYRRIINELEPSQVTEWYENGTEIPRTGYQSSDCYRNPTRTVTVKPEDVFIGAGGRRAFMQSLFLGNDVKPINNIWNVKVTGVFTHVPTGLTMNLFWLENSPNTYVANTTYIYYVNAGNTQNALVFPSYPTNKPDGTYSIDYSYGNFGIAVIGVDPIFPNWNPSDVTGQWEITLADRGLL